MKTRYSRCSFSLMVILFSIFLFSIRSADAQSTFNFKDPNIIYKDKDGEPMTMDSVMAFVTKGGFSMKKNDLGNGKTEIILFRESKDAIEKQRKEQKEWIAKWIGKPFPDFTLMDLGGNLVKQ